MNSPPSPTSPRHLKLYAAWEDGALTEALTRGDTLAFTEIYERYWLLLLNTAYRKLGSREAAEELVQDLFTTLWHKREQLQVQSLKPYLLAAVRHRVIDTVRARLTHTDYLAYSVPRLSVVDESTEEHLRASDLSLALLVSLSHLPEHTREVFRLSRFEHQSVPEIALRLKLAPKTVEYHLTRALKELRIRLKDFLGLLFFLGM